MPVTAPISFQVPALDALLGGGLQRGTSYAVVGGTGQGKTSLLKYVAEAALLQRCQVTMIDCAGELPYQWCRRMSHIVGQHFLAPPVSEADRAFELVERAIEQGVDLVTFDAPEALHVSLDSPVGYVTRGIKLLRARVEGTSTVFLHTGQVPGRVLRLAKGERALDTWALETRVNLTSIRAMLEVSVYPPAQDILGPVLMPLHRLVS